MRSPLGYPARLAALEERERKRREALGAGVVLMADGKWKAPPKLRPHLAPPPREWTPQESKIDRLINPLSGLR